jgi:hypothetical protein
LLDLGGVAAPDDGNVEPAIADSDVAKLKTLKPIRQMRIDEAAPPRRVGYEAEEELTSDDSSGGSPCLGAVHPRIGYRWAM